MRPGKYIAVAVGALLAGSGFGAIHIVDRTNFYYIYTPAGNDLSQAYFNGTVNQDTTADNVGDTLDTSFALPQGHMVDWVGDETNLDVKSNITINPATATFKSLDNSQDGISTIDFNIDASEHSTALGSFFAYDPTHGSLTLNSTSAGLVDNGGGYVYNLALQGDWVEGTGLGQVQLGHVNPLWTIDSRFVYDAVLKETFLDLHYNNYQSDGAHNPDLQVILHGQPVPEPMSILALAGGLALLRRRRPLKR